MAEEQKTAPVEETPVPVPADAAASEDHTYKFNITMTCGGCSGAVDRVLKKLDGVKSYEVSLEQQTAVVVAEPTLDYETVLLKISKTGKKINSGEADGVEKSVVVEAQA